MTTTALVVAHDDKKRPCLIQQEIPIPKPGEHQALIKVQYVAQNPTDGKEGFLFREHP